MMSAWRRRRFLASSTIGLGAVGLAAASDRTGAGMEPQPAVPEIRTKDDLPTPALLVDLDRFQANLQKLAAHCRSSGCTLRPHAKTHKCPEVARRQLAAGREGFPWRLFPKRRRWSRPASTACC